MNFTNTTQHNAMGEHTRTLVRIYSFVLYGLVIGISTFGNITVILTIRRTKSMRSMKYLLLTNIGVADLLIATVCMPANIISQIQAGVLQQLTLCKIIPFIQGFTLTCSAFSLVIIAIERYIVLMMSLKRRLTRKHGLRLIILAWFLSAMLAFPHLIVNQVTKMEYGVSCGQSGWSAEKQYILINICLAYVIPTIILGLIYSRILYFQWGRTIPGSQDWPSGMQQGIMKKMLNQTKMRRTLLSMVLVFLLCRLPINILDILWHFRKNIGLVDPNYMWIIAFHAEILLYANSAINPILYCGIDQKFRKACKSVFICAKQRSKYRREHMLSISHLVEKTDHGHSESYAETNA